MGGFYYWMRASNGRNRHPLLDAVRSADSGSPGFAVGALLAIPHQKAEKSSSRFWPESLAKIRGNLAF
jgi:hypothetical protein